MPRSLTPHRTARLVLIAALSAALVHVGRAQQPKPDDAANKPKSPAAEKPAPKPSTTHHRVTVDGKAIPYAATAATIDLQNDKAELIGRMFYVAYTQDDVNDAGARPLT